MRSRYLAILGFSALLAVFGCRTPPSDVPVNGCRLTVEDISMNGNMRVAQLAIVSSASCYIAIDSGHIDRARGARGGGVLMEKSANSSSVSGSATFVADRIALPGQTSAYFHTLMRIQTLSGNEWNDAPAAEAVPINTPLDDFFTVTAKTGVYPFDTPVEIGTLRGKPITLTFKRTDKLGRILQ